MRPLEIGLLALGDRRADPFADAGPSAALRPCAALEAAVLAEALGFDSVWLGGPLFGDSAQPVVLAAIAARTERVRLGAVVAATASLDPLRVAEDYATLDGISGGRVELAIGSGIPTDTEESRERLRESLLLLRRLWSETEVSFRGRFRAPLERVTVEPRPVQRPHPPLWVGGGSSHAVDLAAELGLPLLLPGAFAAPEPLVARYRERAAAVGHDPSRLRVGAVIPREIAERLLASREALALDVQLLVVDPGDLREGELRARLDLFAAEVLPRLREAAAS